MTGVGHVLDHLVVAVDEHVAHGILAGVNGALLQRGVLLGGRHRGGNGAHGVEGRDLHLVLHGADLHALEVIHALNGILGEGVTEARLQPADDVHALLGGLGLHELA